MLDAAWISLPGEEIYTGRRPDTGHVKVSGQQTPARNECEKVGSRYVMTLAMRCGRDHEMVRQMTRDGISGVSLKRLQRSTN
ncbi:hypothetical protein GCM10022227_07650 [Streptomyces sedi]